KTRLIAFSDDMDGLRKVPDNVPNKEMLEKHLGQPLTRVPDPFGTHPSFGAHNNARLRTFLDRFGFDYEFASATDYYTSGKFDAKLLLMLERIDQVMAIMLPSLREERAASYSPFLPICPRTGVVLYVPIVAHDAKAGTISYDDPETKERRSEEHTSELQSPCNLVCRLLLEKKKAERGPRIVEGRPFVHGPKLRELERGFPLFLGVPDCARLALRTQAQRHALRPLTLGSGDG